MRKVLALVICLSLSGCWITPGTTAPTIVVTPTGPATSAELTALNEQIASLKASFVSRQALDDIAAAGVWAAQEANKLNPVGLPKEATAAQLEEAAKALPTVSDAKKLEKTNQNARILAGELATVKVEMGQKVTEIEKLKSEKSESDKRAADIASKMAEITSAAEKERNNSQAKLQAQFDAMSKKIKEAQDAANNKIMLDQVMWLNRAGAACEAGAIGLIGIGFFMGGLVMLQRLGPIAAFLGVAGLLCFGLAQIIGMWWFKWACLISVAIIVVWVGIWLYRHYKQGDLKQEAETRASKLTGVISKVIPVLDTAYNDAEGDIKKFMDDHIFSQLNSKMDSKDKATVHELRAVDSDPAAIPIK